MKVTGIIAEYNPFHNGHKYQIDKARENGADYVVVAMSGDFTQRGEPALFDKYTRAEMTLSGGADLVLELPVVYATSDAGRFARGGVSLLDSLGVVDELSFGIESGCEDLCYRLADFLHNPPSEYSESIKQAIKAGNTYPVARTMALNNYFKPDEIARLNGSNMILGLEYMQALKEFNSSIIPVPLTRMGAGYNDTEINPDGFSSASGIRQAIQSACHNTASADTVTFSKSLPYDINSVINVATPLFTDDFSSLLHYKLISEDNYSIYLDIEKSFSDRILSFRNEYTGINSFADILKSKNITRTSVMRLLTHILLGITEAVPSKVPYARILGFRKDSEQLLSLIKNNSSVPMVSKLADAQMCDCLAADIRSADIYNTIVTSKTLQKQRNEYTKGIVIK